MGGVASFLVGLNNGEVKWDRVQTIVPLVVGLAAIIAGAINEMYTKSSPVIPPRVFKTRTAMGVFGILLAHGIVLFAGAYYLPVYFQVLGDSPFIAGMKCLPFALGSTIGSLAGGIIVAKVYRNYKVVMMGALAIMTVRPVKSMSTIYS